LPRRVDTALSWFLVSPDMHKVHHHYILPYTDSNYGNIFSIWDRFFGTFRKLDREKIVYGVDTFPDEIENGSIKGLLKQPFNTYRKPTTGA
jgi:sterol desaturase/sphingolipid hydroxylase (fatty acid hydroxylase superfamily)